MTLTSTTVKLTYNGDGAQTAFPVTFNFWDLDDLRVILRDENVTPATETTMTRGATYNVTGGNGSTGTVDIITPPSSNIPVSGEKLIIKSDVPSTQTTTLPLGGAIPSASLEQRMDKNVRLTQQVEEVLSRAPLLEETTSLTNPAFPAPGAGNYIRWNVAGDELEAVSAVNDSGNFLQSGTGAVSRSVASKIGEVISVKDFGAVGDGITDDTVAIQAAIDAANVAGGGFVDGGNLQYLISSQGVHATINYGIMLKDNVTLRNIRLKAAASSDMIVVTDDRTVTSTKLGLVNVEIDGNFSNQTAGVFMNLWIKNSASLYIEKLTSIESTSLSVRLEDVDGGFIRNVKSTNTNTATGTDGFHLYDCSNISGSDFIIDVVGDDGFVITAESKDSTDLSFSNIVVTTPVTGSGGGRGILLNLSDTAEAASNQFTIKNVSLKGVVTSNCKGPALLLVYAQFENINIDLIDYGSKNGVDFSVGSSNVVGYIKNSRFNVTSQNADQAGISTVITSGVIENNKIDAIIYNPGDTYVGAVLYGERWQGSILVDYDPNANKVTPSLGLDLFVTKSNLLLTVDGGTNSINCRAAASDNTLRLGRVENGTLKSLVLNSSNNNSIVGGSLSGSITNSGSGNIFFGVKGANSYGSGNISPDANGNGTIAHGLVGTPTSIFVGVRGDNDRGVDVQAVDGTNITVRIKDAAGADVTTGTLVVDWEARL